MLFILSIFGFHFVFKIGSIKESLWKYINKNQAAQHCSAWESCQLRNSNKHGRHSV